MSSQQFFFILFGRERLKQSKTNKSEERDFRACDRWKVDSHTVASDTGKATEKSGGV